MSKMLSSIINKSQVAFVSGQRIHDHIHLAYELIKGYNRKHGMPRCMMQMDIQKAYDIVDLQALHTILKEICFPKQSIG